MSDCYRCLFIVLSMISNVLQVCPARVHGTSRLLGLFFIMLACCHVGSRRFVLEEWVMLINGFVNLHKTYCTLGLQRQIYDSLDGTLAVKEADP